MNLAREGGGCAPHILFANFNQDCTSLSVGTKNGYKLYSLASLDKLENIYESESSEDISIIERLFSSSLVAVVSLSSPRKLKVCHFKKGTEICNYSYSNTILGVKLNRSKLVVCLEESLYIHSIRDMKVAHTIRDTPPNPNGVCALSVHNDNCFLAYPGSNQIGEVQIFDCSNLRAVAMLPAHDNPLAALAFNPLGTKIATASEKGTVIRVFSIPEGQKLYEFRRGVKRCATIHSLAFSFPDSSFLTCSSNTETVHIFKLENSRERPPEEGQGWINYFGQALKTSSHYLPSQVTEMFNQGRDFAVARLPVSDMKNVSALAYIQKRPYLLMACGNGYLYYYSLDVTEGGECTLVKQHRIDGQPAEQLQNEEQQELPKTDDDAKADTNVTVEQSTLTTVETAGGAHANTPSSYSSLLHPPQQESNTHPTTNHTPIGDNTAKMPRVDNAGAFKQGSGKNCSNNKFLTRSDLEWSENSFARVVERDPNHPEPETTEAKLEQAIRNQHKDSIVYQSVDQLSNEEDSYIPGIGALRLDDEDEFPPMVQKAD